PAARLPRLFAVSGLLLFPGCSPAGPFTEIRRRQLPSPPPPARGSARLNPQESSGTHHDTRGVRDRIEENPGPGRLLKVTATRKFCRHFPFTIPVLARI
ncbi:hypothetical protein, partial [Streptomyces sp. NPDC059003]|uniref:hypothetical protein n=1 Tax=Streptomyces sp. NPDC059003 TaxID=3346691 RepID=UPI003692DFDC